MTPLRLSLSDGSGTSTYIDKHKEQKTAHIEGSLRDNGNKIKRENDRKCFYGYFQLHVLENNNQSICAIPSATREEKLSSSQMESISLSFPLR